MNVVTKNVALPDGRVITIETGKLAKQADGSVMLRLGNTMLLATVCAAKDAVPGTDFMPLQVEYKDSANERNTKLDLTFHGECSMSSLFSIAKIVQTNGM